MNEEIIEWTFNGEYTCIRGYRPRDYNKTIRDLQLAGVRLIIEDRVEQIPRMMLTVALYINGHRIATDGTDVTSITMTDSVKTLGEGAFHDFERLEEIVWSKDLESSLLKSSHSIWTNKLYPAFL